MHLQRRYARVALDRLQHPVLRHVLRVWDGKRNGRAYPARPDLRPRDFAPYLRHLSLARAINGSDDFELRILGDAIVQAYGENYTGRTLSSIAEFVGEAVVAAYQSVVIEGIPIVLHGSFERPRNHHFRRELVLMPLGTNGEVEFVLSAGILTPHDSDVRNPDNLIESTAA